MKKMFEVEKNAQLRIEELKRRLDAANSDAKNTESELNHHVTENRIHANKEFVAGAQETVFQILQDPVIQAHIQQIFGKELGVVGTMFKEELFLRISAEAPSTDSVPVRYHGIDIYDGQSNPMSEYHIAIRFTVHRGQIAWDSATIGFFMRTLEQLCTVSWQSVLYNFTEDRLILPLLYFQRQRTAIQWLFQMYGTQTTPTPQNA